MLVSESIINTLLREIDMLYINREISVSDADDFRYNEVEKYE